MSAQSKTSLSVYAVAIAGTFLIVYGLVQVMKKHTAPPPVNTVRVGERVKALADTRAAAKEQLESYGKIDEAKGVYRLTIATAMRLTEEEYKNPAAARTNLISRAEKANFVPPPPTFE